MKTKTPLFITGRFRSGTSFMWQVFNQLEGFCAWYEPLHPQLHAAIKYTEPKADHVGIDDYWQIYRDNPSFSEGYMADFALQNLYLEADDAYPELACYIQQLIDLSGEQTAVLQFNRVDLRLPWLKAQFPEAKIIHINRNPLQLYHSQRKHIASEHTHDVLYWDAYELPSWCFSLSQHLPIFSVTTSQPKHAFYDFYLLYKLAQLLAAAQAHVCIDLDQQVFQSHAFIDQLESVVSLNSQQRQQVLELVHVPDSPTFSDAEASELAAIMTAVDLLLTESGLAEMLGKKPLETIKQSHPAFWENLKESQVNVLPLLLEVERHKAELTRVLAENKALKATVTQLQQELKVNSASAGADFDE